MKTTALASGVLGVREQGCSFDDESYDRGYFFIANVAGEICIITNGSRYEPHHAWRLVLKGKTT